MSTPPLIALPYVDKMAVPDVTDDSATQDFLHTFVRQYEVDRQIQAQNILRMGQGGKPPTPPADPDPGFGMGVNSLTGLLSSLLCPSIKMGLQLSDGGSRNQVTVAFTYLGVGEFLLGNGGTTTFSNIDITVSGVNGLDTGSEAANTWYAVHVIAGDGQTTVTDPTANNSQFPCQRRAVKQAGLLSLSGTAPTLPPGYSRFRRVGWVRNNGSSNFFQFTNAVNDDWFWWNEDVSAGNFLVLNVTTSAVTFTDVSCAAVAPSTCREVALNQYLNDGVAAAAMVKNKDHANITYQTVLITITNASSGSNESKITVGCDAAQVVQYRSNATTNDVSLCVLGYKDIR